jgi:CheY-like chemotaxis protein/HPt (histidine-containing phosphotransfer) domain-containing protein
MALNQSLMKIILDDFGFGWGMAGNGRIAIDMLKTNHYDLVLMDLQMPEMNGFETTEYIRNSLQSDIPIIALTADVTTVDLAKCKAVGMNDYISKPIDEKILYQKITGLVAKVPVLKYSGEKGIINLTSKVINLDYLKQRTKTNPEKMVELINLFLELTPPLILTIRQSLEGKDWDLLAAAVHKIIPSISIMGIQADYTSIAKKAQDYAASRQNLEQIPELISKLIAVCEQAFIELQAEVLSSKN